MTVSVVIPVRNGGDLLSALLESIRETTPPGVEVEVVVVDDGSTDATAERARELGARVVRIDAGNPATARNRGAESAHGEILLFLDADCRPSPEWLAAHVGAHRRGETVVGGALDLPPGLPLSARCDYYAGWYHAHSRRPAGYVVSHFPSNLSVRREAFLETCRFTEAQPVAYSHEELAWQAELQDRGHRIWFEPLAVAYHRNRAGFANLLRRSYRWGSGAMESKARSGAARLGFIYRNRATALALAATLPVTLTGYVVATWLRARVVEPLLLAPAIFGASTAYAVGMIAGGLRSWDREGSS